MIRARRRGVWDLADGSARNSRLGSSGSSRGRVALVEVLPGWSARESSSNDRLARYRRSSRSGRLAAGEIGAWPAASFTIGSPQQSGRPLRGARLSRKRRGRTDSTDAASSPRSGRARDVPRREWREVTNLTNTYLDRCRPTSTPRMAASTPRSARSARQPGGSRAPTRTCRTSRSAPISDARFAAASSLSRETCSCRATTTRSSCGSSPTSPATWPCERSSSRARTFTRPPPRASSAPTRRRSHRASARRRRWSTTGSPTGSPRSDSLTPSITGRGGAYTSATERSRASSAHRRDDERARDEGQGDAEMGRRRRSRSCARATGRPGRWASASPSTP